MDQTIQTRCKKSIAATGWCGIVQVAAKTRWFIAGAFELWRDIKQFKRSHSLSLLLLIRVCPPPVLICTHRSFYRLRPYEYSVSQCPMVFFDHWDFSSNTGTFVGLFSLPPFWLQKQFFFSWSVVSILSNKAVGLYWRNLLIWRSLWCRGNTNVQK